MTDKPDAVAEDTCDGNLPCRKCLHVCSEEYTKMVAAWRAHIDTLTAENELLTGKLQDAIRESFPAHGQKRIDTLTAERDALQARCEELVDLKQKGKMLVAHNGDIICWDKLLRKKVDALQARIDKAPHEDDCDITRHEIGRIRKNVLLLECNCWKSEGSDQ